MPEHEARVRAFYDHEAEEARSGRRRRQVADWGVGEDVFDRLPSRRFSRAESGHARRSSDSSPPPEAAESELPADSPTPPDRVDPVPRQRASVPRGGVAGWRTIVIGEPREEKSALPARRRPPRTAIERVGPRPDRIVAYAVGLGVLLILIAILSAGH